MKPFPLIQSAVSETALERKTGVIFHKCVCDYARLILTKLYSHSDMYAIIMHLSQVMQDTLVTPWLTVRIWTNTCLECIEDGHASWCHSTMIDGERNMNSWAHVHSRFEVLTPVPCHVNKPRPTNRAESNTHTAKTCNCRRLGEGGRDD